MARRNSSTYRSAAQAHSKVMAAQRELTARQPRAATPAEEEPMHRWTHIIPMAAEIPVEDAESPTATQILEQLSCQSQLLVDLLGAVNALTAAVLCQKNTN